MKTVKIIISLFVLTTLLFSCKKDNNTTASYFEATWEVRQQEITSIDTNYTVDVAAGEHVYTFKTNNTVDIKSPGNVDFTDSWDFIEAEPNDSIDFGMGPSWEIIEKNTDMFRAKFYTNSNTHMIFRLER